ILVRRIEEGETTRGGIIIPDSAKEKPQEGEVVSAGKGKISEEGKVRPLDVKEGDRILFGKYSGTEIKLDGEDFIIMRASGQLGHSAGGGQLFNFQPASGANSGRRFVFVHSRDHFCVDFSECEWIKRGIAQPPYCLFVFRMMRIHPMTMHDAIGMLTLIMPAGKRRIIRANEPVTKQIFKEQTLKEQINVALIGYGLAGET